MATQQKAEARPGDVVEVKVRHVGDVPRTGEILEVLGDPSHPHFRVRWDDGHESIFYPSSDSYVRPAHGAGHAPHAIQELIALLRGHDAEFETLPHPRTQTARAEARALGVSPRETAKTIVVTTDGHYVRAVIAASDRLDLEKLARAAGAAKAQLLTEKELAAAYPQFERGAVPPFGGRDGDDVVVDEAVAACDRVVLEAGSHETSLRVRAADVIALTEATVADIVH